MRKEVLINQPEEWNRIVTSFHKYDVYYLSEYVKAFQIHGDGEPALFYYEDDGIKAVNVFILRDIEADKRFKNQIPQGAYFDITTPYGYGGFLIEGNITRDTVKRLEKEYTDYCINKGIISEFVRFHPLLSDYETLEMLYHISKLGKTIVIPLNSKEEIWNNLTSKNRNMVRKAVKSGVEIYWGRSKDLIKSFMPLYKATMDKDKAKPYYYFGEDFFHSILYDLKNQAVLFYAVYQKHIISMAVLLLTNGHMNYHLSASQKVYQHLAPTNLLLYEAACWGFDNGFKTFHLGGGLGSKEDSLYRFKSSFSRDSDYTFTIGTKIFDQEKYDQLIEIRKKEMQKSNHSDTTMLQSATDFFPLYRGDYL
ncbi:lipid II:glycine glycyltransferase FemX [Anaerocolumna sp.]|uniref:lipid II:glycine glycyltransferase FemX n=1 Tax=Anaerocolumna sp. TaxID=2041569 RepID=UPI0028AF4CA6|nr:GNAT family N-acetyltransferase [Anaerocolumna sp.]